MIVNYLIVRSISIVPLNIILHWSLTLIYDREVVQQLPLLYTVPPSPLFKLGHKKLACGRLSPTIFRVVQQSHILIVWKKPHFRKYSLCGTVCSNYAVNIKSMSFPFPVLLFCRGDRSFRFSFLSILEQRHYDSTIGPTCPK